MIQRPPPLANGICALHRQPNIALCVIDSLGRCPSRDKLRKEGRRECAAGSVRGCGFDLLPGKPLLAALGCSQEVVRRVEVSAGYNHVKAGMSGRYLAHSFRDRLPTGYLHPSKLGQFIEVWSDPADEGQQIAKKPIEPSGIEQGPARTRPDDGIEHDTLSLDFPLPDESGNRADNLRRGQHSDLYP